MTKLPQSKVDALMSLLRFILEGDYTIEAKRHAKGLLHALLGL